MIKTCLFLCKEKQVNEGREKIDVMLNINRNNQSIISRVDLQETCATTEEAEGKI